MIIDKTIGNFYFRSLTADDKDIYMRVQAEEKLKQDNEQLGRQYDRIVGFNILKS